MKIAVLGSGPAGLLAAHACRCLGEDPVIITKDDTPSVISGAQYLHHDIVELTEDGPDGEILYVKIGTEDGYREKIYGVESVESSWSRFDGKLPAWELQRHYHTLWSRMSNEMIPVTVNREMIWKIADQYDIVFSTIPLPAIVVGEFYTAEIYASVSEPNPEMEPTGNVIVYNGLPSVAWYRSSMIFGHSSLEFPANADPAAMYGLDCRKIVKPIKAVIGELPPNVVLLGRYGKWDKSVLADDAFLDAMELLSEVL